MTRSSIKNKIISLFQFLVVAVFILAIESCQDKETPIPDPVIESIGPEQGMPGDIVTITGENFSANASEITIMFGEVAATVTSSTSTSISVQVPDGAVTAKITVTVNGKSVTSSFDFTVFYSPTITSLSTSVGLPGTEVTISGENFSEVEGGNIVKFGEVEASVISSTSTSLVVTVPAEALTAKISITVDGRTGLSEEEFIVPPVIESLSSTSGKTGEKITLTGQRFSPTAVENIVEVGGVKATVTEATETSIVFEIPYDATTGTISLSVKGGTTTSDDDLTVLPDIEEISPAKGPKSSLVTIKGSGFGKTLEANSVTLNGDPVTLIDGGLHELVFEVKEGFTSGELVLEVDGNSASGGIFEIIVEAISFGSDGFDVGYGIASALNGEYYVVGSFQNTLTLGDATLQAVGEDIFVAKFNKDSEVLWVKQISSSFADRATEIIYHSSGIYIAGNIGSNADFDNINVNTANGNLFVAKINSMDEFEWVQNFNGSFLGGLAIDVESNLVVAGSSNSSVDFGNNVTIDVISGEDIFVAKLSSDGQAIWAKSFGGAEDDSANDIGIDSDGNIYFGGGFFGEITFGTNVFNSEGGLDSYLTKIGKEGDVIWARHISGPEWNNLLGLAVDLVGNCLITGYFSGSTDFGSTTLNGIGFEDTFVSKFDADGNELWIKEAGSESFDSGRDIVSDAMGNIYVTGYFEGVAQFGESNLTSSSNSSDVFISKLDMQGNFEWTKRAGSGETDAGESITIDSEGIIRSTGYYRDFAGVFGVTELPNLGGDDVFVWSIFP